MYESLLQCNYLHFERWCCLCTWSVLPGLPGNLCFLLTIFSKAHYKTCLIKLCWFISRSSLLWAVYLCVSLVFFFTFERSWSQQGLRAVNPVTPVICPSSAQVQALTALPTSTCTTATPATTLMATVTTAFARPTSSSASRCGAKVGVWGYVEGLLTGPVWLLKAEKWMQAFKSLLLYLSGAKPAPGICFERVNSAGDPYGNCGKDSKGSFAKCEARWELMFM